MPWSPSEADNFRKGLNDQQKKKWASVANGVLKDGIKQGLSEKAAAARAVRIANSKFVTSSKFNPVIPENFNINVNFNGGSGATQPFARTIEDEPIQEDAVSGADIETVPDGTDLWLTPDRQEQLNALVDECVEKGGSDTECFDVVLSKMKRGLNFEYRVHKMMSECPDCQQMMDDCKAKGMSEDECKKTVMENVRQKMQEKEFAEQFDIPEMEIFRVGTHNGDDFSESDLQEIADNFKSLKDEVRPKLKITHLGDETEQEKLAGLASYGDVVDVFVKELSDGTKRLFAKVSRVPQEVYNWVKDGRFAERSIEIYPEFRLGTKEDRPVYKNVLKAIALLGHQMPAVTGMAPIKLSEQLECQGTSCFREPIQVKSYSEQNSDTQAAIKVFAERLKFETRGLQTVNV